MHNEHTAQSDPRLTTPQRGVRSQRMRRTGVTPPETPLADWAACRVLTKNFFMPKPIWDAKAALADVRRQLARKKRPPHWRKSKLDPYTQKLCELRSAGASLTELQQWLRNCGVTVDRSTLSRWFSSHV